MSIDFDSELAETYITQVRQLEKGGRKIRSRAAVNDHEKKLARDVRRRVDRSTYGYISPPEDELPQVCTVCGNAQALREVGAVYPQHGPRIPRYRCPAH